MVPNHLKKCYSEIIMDQFLAIQLRGTSVAKIILELTESIKERF